LPLTGEAWSSAGGFGKSSLPAKPEIKRLRKLAI
jgi:hypothetical protein